METIILSAIFKSPMVDCGDDISDHKAIDALYGTMREYELLIEEIHAKGIYCTIYMKEILISENIMTTLVLFNKQIYFVYKRITIVH